MSLIRQLWIGIVTMLLLTLGGSFLVSGIAAKHYLEEELRIKNIDNANSLALSISQMDKDPVTLELLISAQFDTGHYEYIALTDPTNKILVERKFEPNTAKRLHKAPNWFIHLFNVDSKPGIALIQDGWKQYGTITLKTHSRYAWDSLWNSSRDLAFWFLLVCLFSGFIGTLILRYISSPLDLVIHQAESIGQRQFIVSNEPKTIEFQRLVRAMNKLSMSVKMMLDRETKQLEQLQRQTQIDALTDLPNREHILNTFTNLLAREDGFYRGAVFILRLADLASINRLKGRAHADFMLRQIATVIHAYLNTQESALAGRLNASDFIIISNSEDVKSQSQVLTSALREQWDTTELDGTQTPIASTDFAHGETLNIILSRLDKALAEAEIKADGKLVHETRENTGKTRDLTEWRQLLNSALEGENLSLAYYTVYGKQKEQFHYESALRLRIDNDWKHANLFIPWAHRLGLQAELNLAALKLALVQASADKIVAINISEQALRDPAFREKTIALLKANGKQSELIWFEFSETSAIKAHYELKTFINQLKVFGCHCGLEHVGSFLTQIPELENLGLQYLKIDGAFIHDIDKNLGDQKFIQGICKIAHSLGMLVFAEQVSTKEEFECLSNLLLDGYTGPYLD